MGGTGGTSGATVGAVGSTAADVVDEAGAGLWAAAAWAVEVAVSAVATPNSSLKRSTACNSGLGVAAAVGAGVGDGVAGGGGATGRETGAEGAGVLPPPRGFDVEAGTNGRRSTTQPH